MKLNGEFELKDKLCWTYKCCVLIWYHYAHYRAPKNPRKATFTKIAGWQNCNFNKCSTSP